MGEPAREIALRPVRDDDGAAILDVMAECFAEYPGCLMEPSEYPELERPATYFDAHAGQFWVAVRGARVVGCVGVTLDGQGELAELKKLYARREARGTGLGRTLIETVEHAARARGASRVHLYSDTRFTTAHAVYEHLGYSRLPDVRELHDVSASLEFHYEKRLL